MHRHEPPVTAKPVKIVLHDKERDFLVIDKPGSIVRHWPISPRYNQTYVVTQASTRLWSVLPPQLSGDSS